MSSGEDGIIFFMKTIISSIITCLIILTNCTKAPTNNNGQEFYRIIPDNTPFITGLVEATNDTVHHYPEVVIGYVSDGNFDPSYEEVQNIEGLYNPTLWTQVVRTLQRFELTFREESKAKVTVTGPLGGPFEKTVEYTYEGNGVYGDIHSELELISSKKYLLKILIPDGRSYLKESQIPEMVEFNVPDTTKLNVVYRPYNDGTPREESIPNKYIKFKFPPNIFITELQSNTSVDRDILLLEPNENFLFEDRGNYLRNGSFYGISTISNQDDSLRKSWIKGLIDESSGSLEKEIDWMRFSYFDNGMWKNFQNLSNWFSTKGQRWDEMFSRFEEALSTRDSIYLFDVSTIEKVGENGEILPKSENDAIGFFAGYFSVYRKTVLIPVRNFDLDSVLTANGY